MTRKVSLSVTASHRRPGVHVRRTQRRATFLLRAVANSVEEVGGVYLARRKTDGKAVAIKKMFAESVADKSACETLRREGVAKVSDFGLANSFDKAGSSVFRKTGEASVHFLSCPRSS